MAKKKVAKKTAKKRVKKVPALPKKLQTEVSSLAGAMEVKLNAKKFGLAMGILCALSMVLFSLWVILVGTGQEWVGIMAQFYFGYSTSIKGTLIGAVYGFIDGFVGGFVFAWIYNKLL